MHRDECNLVAHLQTPRCIASPPSPIRKYITVSGWRPFFALTLHVLRHTTPRSSLPHSFTSTLPLSHCRHSSVARCGAHTNLAQSIHRFLKDCFVSTHLPCLLTIARLSERARRIFTPWSFWSLPLLSLLPPPARDLFLPLPSHLAGVRCAQSPSLSSPLLTRAVRFKLQRIPPLAPAAFRTLQPLLVSSA